MDEFIARQINPNAPTVATPSPAVLTPSPAAPTASSPKKFSLHNSRWYIGAAALIILAIGTGYYYLHRPYTEAQIVSLIRTNVIPSVVQVRCAGVEGGDESQIGTGLYFINNSDHTPWVETNAHVVVGEDGNYHACNVYFPRASDGSFYDSVYPTGQPNLYHDLTAKIGSSTVYGLDYATLPIVQDASSTYPFPPVQTSIYDGIGKLCNRSVFAGKDIGIGDKMYVIGYPGTGNDSVTLTEGIVSGFTGDFDEWIKTSAAVNHGNSGGLAIGENSGCEFGIASAATFDQGANLGYILSSSYIQTFLNSLTGDATYAPPSADATNTSEYLTGRYDFPGFTIDVSGGWTLATSTLDNLGIVSTAFASQCEGALVTFT